MTNSTHRPLYRTGSTQVSTEQEVGWAPQPVRTGFRRENPLSLPGSKPRTVQPIAWSLWACSLDDI